MGYNIVITNCKCEKFIGYTDGRYSSRDTAIEMLNFYRETYKGTTFEIVEAKTHDNRWIRDIKEYL